MEPTPLPKMYTDLADWWPVLSAPEDYAEEAALFRQLLLEAVPERPPRVLELGSGGGSNASHLKADFEMTLVDLSPDMLSVSRALNPECEHIQGDMRTVRLERQFDAVFVHDAVMYMLSEADLRAAIETASLHCRTGGAALFVPDCVKETFQPQTDHGGHDRAGRAMRYLEWSYDPDDSDTTFVTDYAFLLREADGSVRAAYDRHFMGLFPRQTWMRLLEEGGFQVRILPDEFGRDLFCCTKK